MKDSAGSVQSQALFVWRKSYTIGLITGLLGLAAAHPAAASTQAIPTSERNVLLELYGSTNGAAWANNSGWLGASGTECSWYGVSCVYSGRCTPSAKRSAQCPVHISAIGLNLNDLDGVLETVDLDALPYLTDFEAEGDNLYGSIPDFSLTALRTFKVNNNFLSGPIPVLTWNTSLQDFEASINFLSGSIPSLSGLSDLQTFDVHDNRLTGSIPTLSTLYSLQTFDTFNNGLTGLIPPLTGLAELRTFEVSANHLTGSLPNPSGLTKLSVFHTSTNELTGSIPELVNLPELTSFDVSANQLTGGVPNLYGLNALRELIIDVNKLSGFMPAPPPLGQQLEPGKSFLCPNKLIAGYSMAWDTATGVTPWYETCLPGK